MKILLLTYAIDSSAPGVVYQRLLQEMCKYYQIDAVVSKYEPTMPDVINGQVNIIENKTVFSFSGRLNRMFISLFRHDPYNIIWGFKVKKQVSSDYDLVFSFVQQDRIASLYAGRFIQNKYGIKWAIFAVDAVPSPSKIKKQSKSCMGMLSVSDIEASKIYRQARISAVASLLQHVDLLTSANQKMLDYQCSIFANKPTLVKDVVFDPAEQVDAIDPRTDVSCPTFLYAGRIQGNRRIDNLVSAFVRLLKDEPEARLVFVGKIDPLQMKAFEGISDDVMTHVSINGFVNDLLPYYSEATVLLDLDIDSDYNVFLSSKITSYVSIPRVILCETDSNSPSSMLLGGLKTVIHCAHNATSVYEGMKKALTVARSSDLSFQERDPVRHQFMASTIVEKLNGIISQMVSR